VLEGRAKVESAALLLLLGFGLSPAAAGPGQHVREAAAGCAAPLFLLLGGGRGGAGEALVFSVQTRGALI